MNKYVITGAWIDETDEMFLHVIQPIVCNSLEKARFALVEIAEGKFEGINYEIVNVDWDDDICNCVATETIEFVPGNIIADIGYDWVGINYPVQASYRINVINTEAVDNY